MISQADQLKANVLQTASNTLRQQAETLRVLVADLGFSKEAAVHAVTTNDLSVLNGVKATANPRSTTA